MHWKPSMLLSQHCLQVVGGVADFHIPPLLFYNVQSLVQKSIHCNHICNQNSLVSLVDLKVGCIGAGEHGRAGTGTHTFTGSGIMINKYSYLALTLIYHLVYHITGFQVVSKLFFVESIPRSPCETTYYVGKG